MSHFDFLAQRFIDLVLMEPGRPYEINGYCTVTAIPLAMERTYAFLFEAVGSIPDGQERGGIDEDGHRVRL